MADNINIENVNGLLVAKDTNGTVLQAFSSDKEAALWLATQNTAGDETKSKKSFKDKVNGTLKKVTKIFKKKTPEEKAARDEAKAEKKEAKKQKKIKKAETKYEKAVAKAEKKLARDPDNPFAQEEYAIAMEKAEQKRDKKLEKLGVVKSQVEDIDGPEPQAAAPAQAPTTQTQGAQRAGVSSAYDFGNSADGQPQAQADEAQPEEAQQDGQRKLSPEDELLMMILQTIMRYYMGPEYDYIGAAMSMRDDMFDSRVDQHDEIAELRRQQTLENGNELDGLENDQEPVPAPTEPTLEQPEPAVAPAEPAPAVAEVDRTPLTATEQKSFDSWMATSRISEEDRNKLIENYGPKDAYNIVQKCMAEPRNVMVDTLGEEYKNSKHSIEYFANLDMSKADDKAKADKVIAMDPPKYNPMLMQKMQRA